MEFTKYSFPSKNMEYMVSGTPILTSKLPGMPKEYYDYVYLINDNSPKGVLKSLQETLKNDRKTLHQKGAYAKNVVQTRRILELCQEVNSEIK